MQTDFQKLVKYLKKKHKISQRRIAYILEVQDSTISNCMHNKARCTGDKFVPLLKIMIDILEDKEENAEKDKQDVKEINRELKSDGLWTCPKCGDRQRPFDINNPTCMNRSCKGFKSDNYVVPAIPKYEEVPFISTYRRREIFACIQCGTGQEAMIGRKACLKCGLKY